MKLLKGYIAKIDEKTWSAQTAWEISNIYKKNPQRRDYNEMDDDAINVIKASMNERPEKYAGAIITHYNSNDYLKFKL